MLDLKRSIPDPPKPPIFVEHITVGRESLPVGQQLVLPPGTHHPGRKRSGFSIGWTMSTRFGWMPTTFATAVYTNMPAGQHAFHIRASNSAGVWDRSGIASPITQEPYFYETNGFRLTAATGFVLLLMGGYRLGSDRSAPRCKHHWMNAYWNAPESRRNHIRDRSCECATTDGGSSRRFWREGRMGISESKESTSAPSDWERACSCIPRVEEPG